MSTEITNHPNPSPEVPQETNRLPVVAMRGVVVFPGMTIHFDLVRETFLHALRAGMGKDRRVILVAQKDAIVEDPKPEDFYTVERKAINSKAPGPPMAIWKENAYFRFQRSASLVGISSSSNSPR